MAKNDRRDQLIKKFVQQGPPNFPKFVPKRPGDLPSRKPPGSWGTGRYPSGVAPGTHGLGDPRRKRERGAWNQGAGSDPYQRGLGRASDKKWQRA